MKQCIKCKQSKADKEFYKDYTQCKVCWADYVKSYRLKNTDKIKKYHSKHYQKSKEKINARNRRNWKLRQNDYAKTKKKYREANHEKIKTYRRAYQNNRLRTDMDFKLRKNLRNRIRGLMRYDIKKSAHTMELLGCTIQAFKVHIENQFKNGMSWNNYGEWQIDHIKPCAAFDLSSPEEQKICFHFSNMQPLWKEENRKKGATYPPTL